MEVGLQSAVQLNTWCPALQTFLGTVGGNGAAKWCKGVHTVAPFQINEIALGLRVVLRFRARQTISSAG
jgi:hypothetical protein